MRQQHNVLTFSKRLCLDKLRPVQRRTEKQQQKTSIEVII